MDPSTDIQRLYGLIGYPLSHSFSKRYFSEKFKTLGIRDAVYELFPLEKIADLPPLLFRHPNLKGLNVTIPYKEKVIPYLDVLEESAANIGAVNTISFRSGKLFGYNTDVFGFETSLQNFFSKTGRTPDHALVLGTGGASKAVCWVLDRLKINYQRISRSAHPGVKTYSNLGRHDIREAGLIINTTPLGMAPHQSAFPEIPYEYLTANHMLFDLIYNPEMTLFLEKGVEYGAAVKNGMEMLVLQAEKAWLIWNASNE